MRILWGMLGALLLSVITMDLGLIYVTYDKINTAASHALDAAIIAGTEEADAGMGQVYINEARARDAAISVFRDNLRLDSSLQNAVMKNTGFDLSIADNSSPDQNPYVQAMVTTGVSVMSPRLLGMDTIPITVKKSQYHRAAFK